MSQERKWTPGPWKFDVFDEFPSAIENYDGKEVLFGCGCCGSPGLGRDDAHLIASAPDLYEALEDVMLNGLDSNNVNRVAEALAKARGE